jgi:hypothetical protein
LIFYPDEPARQYEERALKAYTSFISGDKNSILSFKKGGQTAHLLPKSTQTNLEKRDCFSLTN